MLFGPTIYISLEWSGSKSHEGNNFIFIKIYKKNQHSALKFWRKSYCKSNNGCTVIFVGDEGKATYREHTQPVKNFTVGPFASI